MKIILATIASLAIMNTSAAAQTDKKSSHNADAEGGGSGIFMDKRSPEEREPCIVTSSGGSGI